MKQQPKISEDDLPTISLSRSTKIADFEIQAFALSVSGKTEKSCLKQFQTVIKMIDSAEKIENETKH